MRPRNLALAALLALAPTVVQAQYATGVMPKACWPERDLKGRDSVFAILPCNDIRVLPPGMRTQVDCTLARMTKGGWSPLLFETYRSDARQRFLYSYGRTRPGARVTNAKDAKTTVHHYRMAVDIIDRKKGWDAPRFFHWLAIHAESCGLVAGAFWTRFPDRPHLQFGAWDGAPPPWARTLVTDSIGIVWLRVGAAR